MRQDSSSIRVFIYPDGEYILAEEHSDIEHRSKGLDFMEVELSDLELTYLEVWAPKLANGESLESLRAQPPKTVIVLCWGASHYAQLLRINYIDPDRSIFAVNAEKLEAEILGRTVETLELLVDQSFWSLPSTTREPIIDLLKARGFNWEEVLLVAKQQATKAGSHELI